MKTSNTTSPLIPPVIMPPPPMDPAGYREWNIARQNAMAQDVLAGNMVTTEEDLMPYGEIEIEDAQGQQVRVLGQYSSIGSGGKQWQVSIVDNKPTIAAGSVLFDDPLALTPATVTGYDPTTGWTAASAPADGEFVCFELTMDSSADITAIELSVRDVSADGWYDVTGAYISSMFIPLAKIDVTSGVYSVEYQFVNSIAFLERVLIDQFNGYWLR